MSVRSLLFITACAYLVGLVAAACTTIADCSANQYCYDAYGPNNYCYTCTDSSYPCNDNNSLDDDCSPCQSTPTPSSPSTPTPSSPSTPTPSSPSTPTPSSTGWSLQNGDTLSLSANTCPDGTQCQTLCGQGYSVSLSGSTYTLTPTASVSSLPSDCECYTLSGTVQSSQISGSISGFGAVTVSETVAGSTYSVNVQAISCTLTYTTSQSSGTSSPSPVTGESVTTLLSGSGTVPALGYVVSEPGTGVDCAKYVVNTNANTDKIIAAVVTSVNAAAIQSASYGSVSAAYNDIKSKAVSGSFCDYADFADSTCTKIVLLDSSTTYYLGVANSDTIPHTGSWTVTTCTSAEKANAAAASDGSRLVLDSALALLIGATLMLY